MVVQDGDDEESRVIGNTSAEHDRELTGICRDGGGSKVKGGALLAGDPSLIHLDEGLDQLEQRVLRGVGEGR